jgi:integrase
VAKSNLLNAMRVKTLTAPGRYPDGHGLLLQVRSAENRSWILRFMLNGKAREMGLGAERDVSLAAARILAAKAREMLAQGIDPLAQRQTEQSAKRAAAEAVRAETDAKTFWDVTEVFLDSRAAEWGNAKHGKQWRATLEAYARPVLGHLRVDRINVEDIKNTLNPIWHVRTETASRVRGRIEAILDYARVMGWRTGENPAQWRGTISHLYPAKTKISPVEHHAALPWAELPAAMAGLAQSEGTSALALRFGILTATRYKEFSGALWSEIDLAAKVWSIPATRMKARKAHRIPLSNEALAALEAAKSLKTDDSNLVFPGGKKGKQLSDVAVSKALSQVAQGYTVHGCRSTFRDWCGECTSHPREVAEAALAHVNGNQTEAAYARSDLFEKRRTLMADWATYATNATQSCHSS